MVVATIPVSDLERSKAFYGGTLGLELRWGVRPLSGSGAERPVRFPSSSGRPPGPSPTLAHFEVTDIEAVIKDLEAKGVEFIDYTEGPLVTKHHIAQVGPARGAWFRDPDGNMLGLRQG